VTYNAFARATSYRAKLSDAAAEVLRHLSRGLDRLACRQKEDALVVPKRQSANSGKHRMTDAYTRGRFSADRFSKEQGKAWPLASRSTIQTIPISMARTAAIPQFGMTAM
jgi:hypothetical protein